MKRNVSYVIMKLRQQTIWFLIALLQKRYDKVVVASIANRSTTIPGWRKIARFRKSKTKSDQTSLALITTWHMWKEQSRGIFENCSCPPSGLLVQIRESMANLAMALREQSYICVLARVFSVSSLFSLPATCHCKDFPSTITQEAISSCFPLKKKIAHQLVTSPTIPAW
jgi:hypothetical protein